MPTNSRGTVTTEVLKSLKSVSSQRVTKGNLHFKTILILMLQGELLRKGQEMHTGSPGERALL